MSNQVHRKSQTHNDPVQYLNSKTKKFGAKVADTKYCIGLLNNSNEDASNGYVRQKSMHWMICCHHKGITR